MNIRQNLGINPGITTENPEIPGLENGAGIAFHMHRPTDSDWSSAVTVALSCIVSETEIFHVCCFVGAKKINKMKYWSKIARPIFITDLHSTPPVKGDAILPYFVQKEV